MRSSSAWLTLICVATAIVSAEPVTFTKQIAPLMFDRCAPCHRPGESGPFSLLTYADAKSHATQIAAVTKSRYMPPWLPESGPRFDGERRLSDSEISLFQTWAAHGAPEGNPRDLPPAPNFTEGWQLGTPDLIVSMPRPFTLQPATTDIFRNFVLRVPVSETRYVKAVEIRPGNKKVVHHANLLIDRTQSSRLLEGQDGQPGFTGMDINIESNVFDPDGYFLFWKPGTVPFVEAPGMSWRLDKETDLVLNMHLQPSGKPEEIAATVGLYFTDRPPERFPMLLQLEHDGALDIPAGARDFIVSDQFTLPLDVDVLGVYPHAHYLGKDLLAYAILPGGERYTLIHIPHWDLNWQAVYRYAKPVLLPKGTIIGMRYSYDNSEANVANPNHPPKRVLGGNLATDEMSHLWLQVVPRGKQDSRMLLQEALARHTLDKYPADFSAHYNLGALLQLREQPEKAAEQFRAALAAKPDNVTVLNSLGASLEAQGKLDEAAVPLQRAIALQPGYVDARYNLGNLLMAQDRPEEAADQFRAVVQAKPDDQAAHDHYIDALEQASSRHNNLGVEYAKHGDMGQAVREFEKAVRLNARNTSARENLDHARAQLDGRK